MMDSIIVFDGTSYFVESISYILAEDEEVVFRGNYNDASEECDRLNDECIDKPRFAYYR